MREFVAGTIVLILAVGFVGCGGTERAVKKGETFRATEELRETATTQWEESYSDGFEYVIQPGTVLEVMYNTTPGAPYFECTIVGLDGRKDKPYIEEQVVPERIRRREGFLGFTFSLPKSYIGTKIVEAD
jgi:hypothetical protein